MADDYTDSRKAFNEGCDARLWGRPLRANPYTGPAQIYQWSAWRAGWTEANEHYAAYVGGRWPVKKLPPVAA